MFYFTPNYELSQTVLTNNEKIRYGKTMSVDNGQPGGISPQEASVTNPWVIDGPQRYNRLLNMSNAALERRAAQKIQGSHEINKPTTVELGSNGSSITILPSKILGHGVLLTDHEIRPLGRNNTLGRTNDNTIQFRDASVSREHARIDQWRGWKLSDRNSSNGTYMEPVKSLTHLSSDNGARALPMGEWVSSPIHTLTVNLPAMPIQIRERTPGQYLVCMEGQRFEPLTEGSVVTVGSNQEATQGRVRDTMNLPQRSFPDGGQLSIGLYEGQVYLGNFSRHPISVEDPSEARTQPYPPDASRLVTQPLSPDVVKVDTQETRSSTPKSRKSFLGKHFPGLFGNEQKGNQEVALIARPTGAHSIESSKRNAPDENEDMTLAMDSFIAAIDGMGGMQGFNVKGRDAALICREALMREMHAIQKKGTTSIDEVKKAYERAWDKAKTQMPYGIGAVLAVAQDVGDSIVYAHSGDARIGIVKNNGHVTWLTKDQGQIPPDALPYFDRALSINDIPDRYKHLWNPTSRSVVKNAIMQNTGTATIAVYKKQPDDKYTIASTDGWHENRAQGEYEGDFRESIQRKEPIRDIARQQTQAARRRSTDGTFRSRPDDSSLSMMDIED